MRTFGDGLIRSEQIYDRLGHESESRLYEDPASSASYSRVIRQYGGLGRSAQVSNPFCSGWPVNTVSQYDALGRIVSVTSPRNAVTQTSYAANVATTTDPAGKTRQTTTDALGRIRQVKEFPNNIQPDYVTTYTTA